MIKLLSKQDGFAAFIAIAMVTLLTVLGLVAIDFSNDEITLAGNERSELRAFYAAEAGLERATSEIQAEYMKTAKPPETAPSGTFSVNEVEVEFGSVDQGPAEIRDLTTGPTAGLYAQVKDFVVSSKGSDESVGGVVQLTENFQVALIPLFQFAIFYENDLELHPGPDMTLVGRVHSNNDIYFGANSSLNIESYVTSAGSIYHGRHPASGLGSGSGQVNIKDALGNYQGMYNGSAWLDANDPNWYDSSSARWDGRVQDQAHGQEKLSLPLTSTLDPHKIIEQDGGGVNPDSYENKAGLKIIDQQVFQDVGGGTWVDATAIAVAEGWFTATNNSFKDYRENKQVDAVEIDMAGFKSSSLFPANGVVYVSDREPSRDFPALHLKNGADIGGPLTWISENPIYIQGDYNTTNKQPASAMGDAVTFLSDNWDATKGNTNKNNRVANPTTVNVSFVTGNVPSAGGTYSGGVENLPRFLEKWSGKNFTWRGSMINLWESQQANSSWSGGYYSPPIRDWGFDPALDDPNNLPPGTPMARSFIRIGWQQVNVGYAKAKTP